MNLRRASKGRRYQKAELEGYHLPSLEGATELRVLQGRWQNVKYHQVRMGKWQWCWCRYFWWSVSHRLKITQHSPQKVRAHNCFPLPHGRGNILHHSTLAITGREMMYAFSSPGFVIQTGTSFPVRLLLLNGRQGCRAGEAVNRIPCHIQVQTSSLLLKRGLWPRMSWYECVCGFELVSWLFQFPDLRNDPLVLATSIESMFSTMHYISCFHAYYLMMIPVFQMRKRRVPRPYSL